MKWIASNGGPLICLAKNAIASWGGIDFLTAASISDERFQNDYERACSVDDYLGRIALEHGEGIVLGDEPMMTTVATMFRSRTEFIRIVYCSSLVDVESFIGSYQKHTGLEELSRLQLNNLEADWCMFDAAYAGSSVEKKCLQFNVPVGDVRITTFKFQPNKNNYMIIHALSGSVE